MLAFPRLGTVLTLAMLLAWVAPALVRGHEVPSDVRLNIFVRPAGDRLELLVRAPLGAMQEVEFPLRGPGYLEVSKADEALRTAAKVWLADQFDLYENGVLLPAPAIAKARVSLASDRSFTSFESARARVDAPPLDDALDLYWAQQFLDVLLEYPIASDRSNFALRPRVDRLGLAVATTLRFVTPEGAIRAYALHGDPGVIALDPTWWQAARTFVVEGFRHILGGIDHLLFVLCLVIPFRRLRPLAIIVTAFTVGHSISLAAAAFGHAPDGLWFPPLVETLIAATILYMALENIVGSRLERRWLVAFAFGLIHGFGFSFALRETLQFAGEHLAVSLLAFNLGVELGQLAVLLVAVPLLELLFRHVVRERLGIIILSAFVAHTAWHWLLERGEVLLQYPLPPLDALFFARLFRFLFVATVLVALAWAVRLLLLRRPRAPPAAPPLPSKERLPAE